MPLAQSLMTWLYAKAPVWLRREECCGCCREPWCDEGTQPWLGQWARSAICRLFSSISCLSLPCTWFLYRLLNTPSNSGGKNWFDLICILHSFQRCHKRPDASSTTFILIHRTGLLYSLFNNKTVPRYRIQTFLVDAKRAFGMLSRQRFGESILGHCSPRASVPTPSPLLPPSAGDHT